MKSYEETMNECRKTLEFYVPIVERVHGPAHPEFHEVRRLFEELKGEKKDPETLFARLREVTDRYTVPGDVCESYAAVYTMLSELDAAHQAGK